MTVAQMMQTMHWAEYQEWRMLDMIDPWGDRRADWHAARIAQSVTAPHVKSVPPLADFLTFDEKRFDPEPTEDQMWDALDCLLDRAAASAARADGSA